MAQKSNPQPHHFLQSLIFVMLAVFFIPSQPVCDSIASLPVKDGISQINPTVSRDEQGSPAAQGLSLTPEESAWLKEHPDITVAFEGDYAPCRFQSDKGEFMGIAAEMARELARRIGVRKDRPLMAGFLKRALASITREELRGIHRDHSQ